MNGIYKTRVRTLLLICLIAIAQGMAQAQPVSRETALRAATTFLNNNGVASADLVDVTAAVGFANVYVFTTDHGFVLLASSVVHQS